MPGCYKLIVDDSDCEGYKWWANKAAGNGNVRINYPELNSLKVKKPRLTQRAGVFNYSLNLPE